MKKSLRNLGLLTTCMLFFVAIAACSPASQGSTGTTTITVGTVNNSQMVQMEQLTTQVFEKENPTIKVKFVTLPEDDLRTKVTQDVATNAGQFDVATIGNYDTTIWAHNGWIENLTPLLNNMSAADKSSYDYNDLLKPVMSSLSYQNNTYSLPFYAESSMIMYNKQLFASHNLTMPLHPTWTQIEHFAQVLNDPAKGVAGIVLRGQDGWGMNLAPLDTMINAFGGSWFNEDWAPQLTSTASEQAVTTYVNLLKNYGEAGASTAGWQECISLMSQGKAGIFYDATSLAGQLETPSTSKIAGDVGYAYAPTDVTSNGSHWLWAWALGLVKSSHNQSAAFKFMTWATSSQYLTLAGKTFGWVNVPPGTRTSLYQNTNYQKAAPFAALTLASINSATPNTPTLNPVPYTGTEFVDIPQFETAGQTISEYISAVIAGKMTVDAALKQADQLLSSQVNKTNTAGY